MRIVIAGGHGTIALLLERNLTAQGHHLTGLIRNPDQRAAVDATGAPPADTDDVFAAYLRAKHAAEVDLRGRDLDWTILRPGRLTNDPPTGHVHLDARVPAAAISRADVAAVCGALLDAPRTTGHTLEVVDGPTPIAEAVARHTR